MSFRCVIQASEHEVDAEKRLKDVQKLIRISTHVRLTIYSPHLMNHT